MDGITFRISGTFKGPFKEIAEQMPRLEKRALYKAAYFLREKIRESLSSKLPKATQKNPKYIDTLVDAVGFTKVDGASLTVNAMGNRHPRSGTYRTRFFENNTRDRYQKSYRGVKLKKKRFLGHITGTHFFANAVEANREGAVQLMQEVLSQYVEQAFKNTN